jgi:hypothetical protein
MKIEKGIPIPAVKADSAMYAKIAKEMGDGDSVLCVAKEATAMCAQIRNLGFKATQRKQPDGKIRVWKIKEAS